MTTMRTNGRDPDDDGAHPAPAKKGRVEEMIAWLNANRAQLESREKVTITFHCGQRDVAVEVMVKQQVAVFGG